MTKKDYIAIAKALATIKGSDFAQDNAYAVSITLSAVAMAFATICEQDNPRFNRQRFLDACGVE